QRVRNAREVLALQVAPHGRYLAAALEFAPDRAVQRLIELGEMKTRLRIVELDLTVENPLRDGFAHQIVEDAALNRQHLSGERIIHARRRQSDAVDVVSIEIIHLRAPEHGVALARFEIAALPAVPQLARQDKTPARESQRIVAEIGLVRLRVDG